MGKIMTGVNPGEGNRILIRRICAENPLGIKDVTRADTGFRPSKIIIILPLKHYTGASVYPPGKPGQRHGHTILVVWDLLENAEFIICSGVVDDCYSIRMVHKIGLKRCKINYTKNFLSGDGLGIANIKKNMVLPLGCFSEKSRPNWGFR